MTLRIENAAQVADRKAKKAAAFAAMLRDPDLADLVGSLLDGSNSGIEPRRPAATNGERPGVRDAIRKLLDDDEHPFFEMRRFDSDNVKNFLDDLYGKDAYSAKAIRDAMYHLSEGTKTPALKKAYTGKGGRTNEYERT